MVKLDASTGKWIDDGEGAKALEASQSHGNALSDAEVEALATLPAEKLIALVRASLGAAKYIRVGLLTEDEAYEAARLKLLEAGLSEVGAGKMIPPLREWMDRTRGRSTQTINMNQNVNSKHLILNMSTEQIMTELSQLTNLPAGVKLLDNGMLEVSDTQDVVAEDIFPVGK